MTQQSATSLTDQPRVIVFCALVLQAALMSTAGAAGTEPRLPETSSEATLQSAPAPSATLPRSRVIGVASALGSEFNWSVARIETGSHMDRDLRGRIWVPDKSLDLAAIRGVRSALTKAFPEAEFEYMRLERDLLPEVLPERREEATLQALLAQLEAVPNRSRWERLVLLTPAFRGFGSEGLGAKLFGVGVYVRDFGWSGADDYYARSGYDVIEPDGTLGLQRQRSYVALYGFMNVIVVDPASLSVIERHRWSFDEKIHDSRAGALYVSRAIPLDVLAARFESFVERVSTSAVAATLGGSVTAGELQVIDTVASPTVPYEKKPSWTNQLR